MIKHHRRFSRIRVVALACLAMLFLSGEAFAQNKLKVGDKGPRIQVK